MPDQLAEYPVPGGQSPDPCLLGLADPDRDELGEALMGTYDTKCAVFGIDQNHRGLGDVAQHLGEIQLAAHRQDRLQQPVEASSGAADHADLGLEFFEQLVQT